MRVWSFSDSQIEWIYLFDGNEYTFLVWKRVRRDIAKPLSSMGACWYIILPLFSGDASFDGG
jgi:hypothetical protein